MIRTGRRDGGRERGRRRRFIRGVRRRGHQLARQFEERGDVAGEKRLERHWRRDIHRIVGDDLLERRERLGRRGECPARIELQRARQPVAQGLRERLLFTERSALARFVQQRRQVIGELGRMERPPQHERERNQPDTGDVGAMVEARHARARRHRDAELLPEPLAAELQLFDGGGEDVLDDDQPRVRRDDQTLGRDQTVRDFARVLVQERNRRDQLANQTQRGVDVELQVALVRHAQDVGEARAFDVIRNDREPGPGHLHTVDPPHAGVVGMAEVRQAGRALAQRELERWHRRERGTNAENLQQFAGRAVRGDDALAQAIAEEWSFGPFVRKRYGCHGGPRLRAATIGPERTRLIGSAANR